MYRVQGGRHPPGSGCFVVSPASVALQLGALCMYLEHDLECRPESLNASRKCVWQTSADTSSPHVSCMYPACKSHMRSFLQVCLPCNRYRGAQRGSSRKLLPALVHSVLHTWRPTQVTKRRSLRRSPLNSLGSRADRTSPGFTYPECICSVSRTYLVCKCPINAPCHSHVFRN